MGKAKIGILRWEEGHVPQGLMQLENLKGNSTNPASYPFEVDMRHVKGACTETIITHPSKEVMNEMIRIGKEMEKEGVKAIVGSCGFNAIFQEEIANALNIPVFMSSLLQVPYVANIIGKDKTIAIMTAYGSRLTRKHLECCGITDEKLEILGLENCKEWNSIFEKEDEPVDMDLVENEIMTTALDAVKKNPNIKAFVLECTDLPPFGPKIMEATGLPVFSINTLIGYMGIMLGEIKMY